MNVNRLIRSLPLITIILLVVLIPYYTSAESLKWSAFEIPADGQSGKWVLAEGSDIFCLAVSPDGTLYCSANPLQTVYRLFKSTDGGQSWLPIGRVEDTIRKIVIVPGHPEQVYYASISKVFKSSDGGNSFKPVVQHPGGAGANGIEITSMDVIDTGEGNQIIIGTRDNHPDLYGGIYLLDENEPFNLQNLNAGDLDILDVVFSPAYADDWQILAVGADETGTRIMENILGEGWGKTIGDALIGGISATSAELVLPEDYASFDFQEGREFFVSLSTGDGGGDVYRISEKLAPSPSSAIDLEIGLEYGMESVDVTSLAIAGKGGDSVLLAGTGDSARVYTSLDGGDHWTVSKKSPTGERVTGISLSPGSAADGLVYVATAGVESAFSVSRDRGSIWEQVGLIDTRILDIIDLAVSPDYEHDATLFLLTGNVERSLWRSSDGGRSWSRIFSTLEPQIDRVDMILLSSSYSRNREFYLSGISEGKPAIWRIKNEGQSFLRLLSFDPVTRTPAQVDCWTIAPDDTLFIGSYDGSRGVVYQLPPGRTFYNRRAFVGNLSLNSLALSPAYPEDKTILVGNTGGSVYISEDDGYSFEPLPQNSAFSSPAGAVSTAFDVDFIRNHTIYAASNVKDAGIYRFTLGGRTTWSRIDRNLPEGNKIAQILTSSTGQLYAVDLQPVDLTEEKGGITRSLDPSANGTGFDMVVRGLSDGMILKKIRASGNLLWAVDAIGGSLLTLKDTAIRNVELLSPASGSPGMEIRNISLVWRAIEGVTGYRWQINTENDFTEVPDSWQGVVQSNSVRLPALQPDTTYFWRVRSESPVEGPWSERWSFTTLLTAEPQAPRLTAPAAAAENVPITPVFQWSAFAGADKYEIMVAEDNSFDSPVILKTGSNAIPSTAWKSDVMLEYGRTYYWKVRAVNPASFSAWSPVNAFTTMAQRSPVATITVTQFPVILPGGGSLAPTVTVTPSPASDVTADSTLRLIYILLGVLMALLVVLAIVVLYLVRLFRRRYL